jgi:hypothetical protein
MSRISFFPITERVFSLRPRVFCWEKNLSGRRKGVAEMRIGTHTTIVFAVFLLMMPVVATAQATDGELLKAAERGDTNSVKALIAAGADVDARARDDMTCLMKAARNGHTDTVKALIAAGADVNAHERLHDWTALKMASWGGHAEMVKALLAAGAYVNLYTGSSHCPSALKYAEKYGHTQVVELLKKAESNPRNVQERPKNTKRHPLAIMWIFWFLFWALPTAVIASYKNRSILAWLIIGSIFAPFGLIVMLFPTIPKPGEKPLSPEAKNMKIEAAGYLIASSECLLGGAFLLDIVFDAGDILEFNAAEERAFCYGAIVLILGSLLVFFKFLKTRRLQEDEIP